VIRGLKRTLAGVAALAGSVLAIAACGSDDEGRTPAACTTGADGLRAALHRAPGAVRLDGTPVSRCLGKQSSGGTLQAVGAAYVEAAAQLAARARREPGGRAALELGYLIGAARRGAAVTQGIHAELLRRLDQELAVVNTRTRAFRRGERAGRRAG
jgi:hypothetical protein